MDDHAINSMPRPGTSLNRPGTQSAGQLNKSMRPMTNGGRPVTGFLRPGTMSRPITGSVGGAPMTASQRLNTAYRNARPGTTRPVTTSGRFVRLGTASMLSQTDGPFIDIERLDLHKYASRPWLARALYDYIAYYERNPRKALELAAHATRVNDYEDWWWKSRLGKAYYQLGLLRDAEKQFLSAMKHGTGIMSPVVALELSKVYVRLDQPNTALEHLERALTKNPGDTHLQLAMGRIHDGMNDMDKGVDIYRQVLQSDACNIESMACLAAHFFYADQPEISLRFFRRMLQIGVSNAELWSNLALCCFTSGQYDMTIVCYEKALGVAEDDVAADVWYNIGHLALGIGDLGLAFQAFRVTVSLQGQHAEALTNLGVLEMRRNHDVEAINYLRAAIRANESLYEPVYNLALLLYRMGDFQEAYQLVEKALLIYPEHSESQELQKTIRQYFTAAT